jgi:protein-S-isoprenylcysteine O-methyltransferase Ste14
METGVSISSVLCDRLRRLRIQFLVSATMFLLAYLDAVNPWLAVRRFEELGIPLATQVLLTGLGAVAVLISNRCGWLFFLGTMPLVARIVVVALVTIEMQGGYQMVVLYSLCLIFVWLLYAQDACYDAE